MAANMMVRTPTTRMKKRCRTWPPAMKPMARKDEDHDEGGPEVGLKQDQTRGESSTMRTPRNSRGSSRTPLPMFEK